MTEGNGEFRELPKGWCWVTIDEIATVTKLAGFEFTKYVNYQEDEDVRVVRGLNVGFGKFKSENFKYIDKATSDALPRSQLYGGELLIAYVGSLGTAAILPKDKHRYHLGPNVGKVVVSKEIGDAKYVLFFLLSSSGQKLIRSSSKAVAQSSLSMGQIRTFCIPFAPLNEQERIVEKIEELFSDVDQGIESLKTAQKQLKVYRQAVLKWAFEGKLTEEWRKQHQSTLKTGEALLAQIKAERENRYQQQLAEWETVVKEWEAIGKVGKKPTKLRKPKEPTLFSKSECSLIPSSWCWVKLEDITDDIFDGPFGSNLKTEDYVNEGIRVIRLENIEHLSFDNSKKTFISEEKYRTLEKHIVYKGDIIFSSFINEEIRATILPNLDTTAIAKADCFCIRNKNELINQKWLVYLLSSRNSYNQLIIETHGFTRPRINTTQLKQFVIPLCPSAEQEQIVEEIESRLSICDQLEDTIVENLQKAEALRQSILKQAFEGKLVPQDPNDEPGEKLLERIKDERQINGNTGKKSKPSHQQLTLQEL